MPAESVDPDADSPSLRVATRGPSRRSASMLGPGPDSELTWLLHRAAQRMRAAVGAEADRRGVMLRAHIVLSALHKTQDLTQLELGHALGMDKTTLTAEIDRLEKAGLVRRRVDPRDRRARIPAITAKGERLRADIAAHTEAAEASALEGLTKGQIAALRKALYAIIGTSDDPGSCL